MDFTANDLLIDTGLICVLMLLGVLLRAKLRFIQSMLLPASIMAGIIGLALGPAALDVLPFSDHLADYTGIINGVVFAALPFTATFTFKKNLGAAKALWAYSVSTYVLQWGLGLLVAIALIAPFFDIPSGFGLLLAAGFVGGYGTAAAVGSTMSAAGWEEATTLGFTSATIGVLIGVIGGIILAKWGVSTGRAGVAKSMAELPDEMRSGMVRDPRRRESIGTGTVSESSIDPLTYQVGIVIAVTAAGQFISLTVDGLTSVSIPLFATAFLTGLVVRLVIDRTPARRYIDGTSMKSISGTATDFLVAVGIASIVPSVVFAYMVPLGLLLLFGLIYCLVIFRFLTPRMFQHGALERGLFTWGWATGAVGTGIALLKIVDPKSKSGTIEEFGIAYVGFGPVEIVMTIVAPAMVIAGLSGQFIIATLVLGIGLLAIAFLRRWNVVPGDANADVPASTRSGHG